VHGAPVVPPLSKKEFDLLACLFETRGKLCPYSRISSRAWPERNGAAVGREEINRIVFSVRKKIDPNGVHKDPIKNVSGRGYILSVAD